MRDVQLIPKRPRPPKRPKPLRSVSVRRLSERETRALVRQEVLERDHYRCVGPDRGLPDRCASPFAHRPALEVHEVEQRSTHPGSHLRPEVCVTLCQHHHDLCTSPSGDLRELVERVGLIVRSRT